MVAGRAGAGKTTMLRALASEIPAEEPFILLEESRELGLHRNPRHQWVMSFESRDGHGERGADGRPAGEITIADLIPVSLRMGAQRIIVGEVRSREIVPMLEAMTTSRGSMCTIHARTAASVTDRIIQLALSYGPSMTRRPGAAHRRQRPRPDRLRQPRRRDRHRRPQAPLRLDIEEVIGTAAGGRIAHTTIFGPSATAGPRRAPARTGPRRPAWPSATTRACSAAGSRPGTAPGAPVRTGSRAAPMNLVLIAFIGGVLWIGARRAR